MHIVVSYYRVALKKPQCVTARLPIGEKKDRNIVNSI